MIGGVTSIQGGESQLQQIADSCMNSVGEDGFGLATIDGDLIISNETAEITVPCHVQLLSGANLTLNNVRLTSRHLEISDDGSNGESHIRFQDSALVGLEDSGFAIDLADSEDSVSLHSSTIDYALSVWIRIYGEDDASPGGGLIEVVDSMLRSMATNSEGIILSASENGGIGRFVRVTFLTLEDTTRLLFAGDCRAQVIVGAPERCSSVDFQQ